MGRIEKAFERRFRDLFAELGARDREKGLGWIRSRATALSIEGATPSHAYTAIAIKLLDRTRAFRERQQPRRAVAIPCRVHCDAGLGGLSRWLRAAGCEAFWRADISDAELVRETQETGAILLTTDSFLLDRRPIVRNEIRALWVPPTLTMLEQFRYVRAELNLTETDESRCMCCGGQLIEVDKEKVRDRIPPRTYKWLDEFFECAQCRQLFWNGTHWRRISRAVRENAPV